MGRFKHEAAACDPDRQVIYLTEDETDGCFYRFVPTTWGDLSSRAPQVLARRHRTSGSFTWANVPDPDGSPDRDPQPGLRREAVQRRRGLLLRQRHLLVHHQGRQPGLELQRRRRRHLELAYDDTLVTPAPPR